MRSIHWRSRRARQASSLSVHPLPLFERDGSLENDGVAMNQPYVMM